MSLTNCPKCNRLACVCAMKERHLDGCRFLRAATCAVPIECSHGRDCCPICDPCTCGAGVLASDLEQPHTEAKCSP